MINQIKMLIRKLIDWTRKILRMLLTLIQSVPFFSALFFMGLGIAWGMLNVCVFIYALFDPYDIAKKSSGTDVFLGFDPLYGEMTLGVAVFTALTLQYSSACEGKEAMRLKVSAKNSFIATCFLASAFFLNLVQEEWGMVISFATTLALFYFALSFFQLIMVLFRRSR